MTLLVGLLVLAPVPARADWQFAPLLGLTFAGNTNVALTLDLKTRWNVGGAVTLMSSGLFGVEAIFNLTPGFLEGENAQALSSSRVYSLMGNVVIAAPSNEYGLRPFLSGGLGLIHANQETLDPRAFPINSNLVGYNVGAGAVGFVSRRTGVRFDLRFYDNLSRSDEAGLALGEVQLRYWAGSIGLVLRY